jgi:excisionase family DNA binding protein
LEIPDAPRRAIPVRQAAAILGADESYIRELVRAGDLQAYRRGKRSIRVFEDSLADYQARAAILPSGGKRRQAAPRPRLAAPQREALAYLASIGLVKPA